MSPSPEIGMDAALTFGLGNGGTTTLDIPAGTARIGFFVSPVLSIEPTFGLHAIKDDHTTYLIGVGALYHFSPSRAATQFYVRPFIDIAGFSIAAAGRTARRCSASAAG